MARAKRHLRGKPPEPSGYQAKHLVELVDLGRRSTAELAERSCLSRSTIHRTLLSA